MSALSDHELVRRAKRGDVSAFEALYMRHRDWVFGVALRFCGDETDAQDATQDVFTYLLAKLPQFRLRGKMTTFLYPVARSCAVTAVRNRRKSQPGESRNEPPLEIHAAAPSERTEELIALEEAVGRLRTEQAEIILMRFVDGFELEQIAEALKLPMGTVKSRLHRGLDQLRRDAAFVRFMTGREENS